MHDAGIAWPAKPTSATSAGQPRVQLRSLLRPQTLLFRTHHLCRGPNGLGDDVNPTEFEHKKLRVGLVLIGGASEGGGGTGRRFARLFQNFQQQGSRADVWLITRPDFLELMSRSSIDIDPNRNVIHFEDKLGTRASNPIRRLTGYREGSDRLAAIAQEGEFDLLHIPIPSLVYAPFLLRRPDGIRQVFSMTAAVGAFDSLDWKAKFLYWLGFECSDAIDTLYSDIAERFPSYASKVNVSPCSFTDYSHYKPAAEKEKWIVFAGRLEAFKNPTLFVDATGLAADVLRQHGWKCLLYGDGELKTSIEEQISRLGLTDLIEFDRVADLSSTLNRSMVFTSIQQTENYPSQVLLEAMAAGNAIIATDVGDTRRLVDENVGLLIDEQTPEALAEALTTLASDRELCERIARNARSRILNQHTIARFAEYMEQLWIDAGAKNEPAPRPSWTRVASMLVQGAAGMRFS